MVKKLFDRIRRWLIFKLGGELIQRNSYISTTNKSIICIECSKIIDYKTSEICGHKYIEKMLVEELARDILPKICEITRTHFDSWSEKYTLRLYVAKKKE